MMIGVAADISTDEAKLVIRRLGLPGLNDICWRYSLVLFFIC